MIEATIRGDASFHQGFTTNGVVDLRLAQIGRGLSFNHARFIGSDENGLSAERSRINETLYWVDITGTPRTELDLANVHVGSLWDDSSSWPGPGRLFLDGFVYGDLSGGPADAQSRLEWLARQPPGYRSQPYGQLARVLRERGSDVGAMDVMIANGDARRRQGGLGWGERMRQGLLDVTIGYGYRPMRALWWIFFFVAGGRDAVRMGLSGACDHADRPRRLRLLNPKRRVAAPLSSVQRRYLFLGELSAARRPESGSVLAP